MSEAKPEFTNFKEAFCAYHRCGPEGYLRKALFCGIPFSRRLLAYPIYLFNRSFFALDFGLLESLGEARNQDEFDGILDELSSTSRVERSIRRGVFGIRISGDNLLLEWDRVKAYVKPPPEVRTEPGKVTPRVLTERVSPSESASREGALPAVVARRLHRAASDVTAGKGVEAAARAAGLAGEVEFRRLLAQQAGSDPALRWLNEQLELGMRVKQLEDEVAGLRVLLGEKERLLREAGGEGATKPDPRRW